MYDVIKTSTWPLLWKSWKRVDHWSEWSPRRLQGDPHSRGESLVTLPRTCHNSDVLRRPIDKKLEKSTCWSQYHPPWPSMVILTSWYPLSWPSWDFLPLPWLSSYSLNTLSFSNFLTPKNPPLAKKRGLGKGGVREEITETIRLWTSSVDHHDTSDRSGESYESQSVDVAIKDRMMEDGGCSDSIVATYWQWYLLSLNVLRTSTVS